MKLPHVAPVTACALPTSCTDFERFAEKDLQKCSGAVEYRLQAMQLIAARGTLSTEHRKQSFKCGTLVPVVASVLGSGLNCEVVPTGFLED